MTVCLQTTEQSPSQQVPEARRQTWTRSCPQKEPTLSTPGSWTSSLHDWQTTHFCGFQLPCLWYSVTAARKPETLPKGPHQAVYTASSVISGQALGHMYQLDLWDPEIKYLENHTG